VSTSTTDEAAGSGLADLTTGVVRRSSAQATRRAVLHVQSPGDSQVPADLAGWFTERGFNFYVAGVRLPRSAALSARRARRDLQSACTDLDTASGRLRRDDGMASVIVTARGRAAVAAALWSASGQASDSGMGDGSGRVARADALILWAPAWPARGCLLLDIACPVLVIGGRLGRRRTPALQLGSHVTWLALADADTDPRRSLTELGRWLGAYMYGSTLDQLL
jgi:hypothetical protein